MRTKIHSLIVVLLYILSGCLQAVMGQGGGSPQNVVWTNLVNVTATGNTLQKTSGCDGCADAGATSEQAIASGDGYFEFTVPSVAGSGSPGSVTATAGRAGRRSTRLPAVGGERRLGVQEGGTYRPLGATYAVGDVLRVAVEGGVVRYYKNGTLIYTSTVAPVYPLQVDTSFFDINGTVGSAMIKIN